MSTRSDCFVGRRRRAGRAELRVSRAGLLRQEEQEEKRHGQDAAAATVLGSLSCYRRRRARLGIPGGLGCIAGSRVTTVIADSMPWREHSGS